MKTASFMDEISWCGEEESMFSFHDVPKINAAQLITHNTHSEMLYLMVGGDTHEFRIFNKEFQPIISISGMNKSTFTCHANKRGDVISIGGGDGIVRVFRFAKLGS